MSLDKLVDKKELIRGVGSIIVGASLIYILNESGAFEWIIKQDIRRHGLFGDWGSNLAGFYYNNGGRYVANIVTGLVFSMVTYLGLKKLSKD